MAEFHSKIKTIEWVDNYSKMVDQTVLPYEFKYVNITGGQEMFDAIKTMIVRGAPAWSCFICSEACERKSFT